ncbi:hypothetical protein BKA70DRAFT_1222580 [Coprinopsis sp. MPI-PUGE-AT-0042]|nr:hypothetical protein BKA70DRAFT_1222580 [Coprinopsis sp. MPI-PUGE-AT-0042]
MSNITTPSAAKSNAQRDQPQHSPQPPITSNSDASQTVIDLSPYVSAPVHRLIGGEEGNQEEAPATAQTESRTVSWLALARTMNLNALLCYVRPQANRDQEEDQMEMRTHQEMEEKKMEEGRIGSEAGLNLQPQARQDMQMMRTMKATETWTINFEMPSRIKLDIGQRIKLRNSGGRRERRSDGIIASVFKRDRTEVIFRIEDVGPRNPELTVYLSTPLRTTQLPKKEGFINWMVTNLLYRGRDLRDPMEKVREDAIDKMKRDTIEADRLLKEAIESHKRARKAEEIRNAAERGGKSKMEADDVKPTPDGPPRAPTARRIRFEGEGEASTSKI